MSGMEGGNLDALAKELIVATENGELKWERGATSRVFVAEMDDGTTVRIEEYPLNDGDGDAVGPAVSMALLENGDEIDEERDCHPLSTIGRLYTAARRSASDAKSRIGKLVAQLRKRNKSA